MHRVIVTLALVFSAALLGAAEIGSNAAVAFLGDSITQYGHNKEAGYVNLTVAGLAQNGIKVRLIKAGVSGNKSNQMLARLKRDVIDKKANFMFLSCGVNDVWHGVRGVPLEDYKKNITAIVEQCQKAGIRVCIMTATMIREDAENAANKKLAGYNDFLRKLAAEKKCLLADTNQAMQSELARLKKEFPGVRGNLLTGDGVHMNPAGDMMMAACLLETVGIPKSKVDFTAMKLNVPVRKFFDGAYTAPGGAPVKAKIDAQVTIPLALYCKLFPEILRQKRNPAVIGDLLTITPGK